MFIYEGRIMHDAFMLIVENWLLQSCYLLEFDLRKWTSRFLKLRENIYRESIYRSISWKRCGETVQKGCGAEENIIMINATSKFVGPLPLAAKKKTLTSPLQQSFLFSDIYSFYFPTVIYVANLEELSMKYEHMFRYRRTKYIFFFNCKTNLGWLTWKSSSYNKYWFF